MLFTKNLKMQHDAGKTEKSISFAPPKEIEV